MKLRIKIRHRSLPPKPWKWEIYGSNLITASHESYASQLEAHRAARWVLKHLAAEKADQADTPTAPERRQSQNDGHGEGGEA